MRPTEEVFTRSRSHDRNLIALRSLLWFGIVLTLTAIPLESAQAQACSATVQGGIAFGTYDPFSAVPLDAQARLRIRCPRNTAPRVTLSRGSSTTYAARELRSGAEVLLYNLFTTAARTTIWGDGTQGSVFIDAPRGNSNRNIFGRIPAGQDPAVGAYTDTITVTLIY
jgi:spore coat protein U-like protein